MPTTTRRTPKRAGAARPATPRPATVAPAAFLDGADARPRTVVLATDGSRVAGSAIRVTRLMSESGRWTPLAMTVLEPLPIAVADMTLGPPSIAYQQGITDGVLGAIQTQLERGGGKAWKFTVQFGRTAPVIARFAREAKADLIVLGLGKHGKLARLAGAETAARVIRSSDMPVLAVGESTRGLPFTAVAAIDFGDSSVRAAKEALKLLQAPGRLHLVHVRGAMSEHTMSDPAWERTYADGVTRGFERALKELGTREGIRITTEYKRGDVVETVLAVAKAIAADLIAAGSHSQAVIERMIIGSTPAQLLRAAPHSVLIAPPMVLDSP